MQQKDQTPMHTWDTSLTLRYFWNCQNYPIKIALLSFKHVQSIAQAYKKHDNHFKFVPWVNTLYLFLDKYICLSLYQLVYGKHKKWTSSLGSDWTSIHWTSTRPSSIQPSPLRKLLSEGLLDFQRFLQIVRKHSKF